MGYHSTVGFQIRFATKADLSTMRERMGAGWYAMLKDVDLEIDGRSIRFQENWTKWDWSSYDLVREMLDNAQLWADLDPEHPNYLASSGFFARIGEDWENGDIEQYSWDGNPHADVPCGYDLGGVTLTIDLTEYDPYNETPDPSL